MRERKLPKTEGSLGAQITEDRDDLSADVSNGLHLENSHYIAESIIKMRPPTLVDNQKIARRETPMCNPKGKCSTIKYLSALC